MYRERINDMDWQERRRGGRQRGALTFLMGGVPFLILSRSLMILLSFCSSALSVSSSTSSCRGRGRVTMATRGMLRAAGC